MADNSGVRTVDSDSIKLVLEQLKTVSEGLSKLDRDLNSLKIDMRAQLTETNGKLKGNHEIIILQLSAHEKQNEMQGKLIETQIESLKEGIAINKKSINQLYDLDRNSSKETDKEHALFLQKVNDTLSGFSERVEKKFDDIDGAVALLNKDVQVNEAVAKTGRTISLWAIGLLTPTVISGIIAALILYGKLKVILNMIGGIDL